MKKKLSFNNLNVATIYFKCILIKYLINVKNTK